MKANKTHSVIVILEAKSGRENELQQALIKVIQPSRAEKTCIDYRLHQSHSNPCEFILYENWESQEAHQEQFHKPYIKELATQIDDLLTKPYQVYFAKPIE